MLPLSQKFLTAAGFEYDTTEQSWVVPVPLPPLVTVECYDGNDIMDALLEVHAVSDANDCTYNNFSISGRYVSIVGLAVAYTAVTS